MRFSALQRLRPDRFTSPRALPARFASVPRVWLPSRRIAPGPASPALFQTGCAPGLRPSEVAQRLRWNGIPAVPNRPGGWNPSAEPHFWHGRTVGPSASRLCPAGVPVAQPRLLPRDRARASPGLYLSAVYSSLGWARPSASLRPLAWPARGHPLAQPATRRLNRRYDHSDPSFAGQSRRMVLPCGRVRTRTPL